MNRKIIVLLITVTAFFLIILAGCELFDGSPERDNINDPDNVLGYTVSLIFTNTNDSIGVKWIQDNVSVKTKYEIYYGTDPDFNNAEKTDFIENTTEYVIDNLQYGENYNIWLRAVDVDTDETVFIKYGTTMPEPNGTFDIDFNNGQPLKGFEDGSYNQTGITGMAAVGENIFISGYRNELAGGENGYNFFREILPDGSTDTSFAGGELLSGMISIPSSRKYKLLWQNDHLMSIQKTTSPIFYYNHDQSPDIDSMITEMFTNDGIVLSDGSFIFGGYHDSGYPELRVARISSSFDTMNDEYSPTTTSIVPGMARSRVTDIAASHDERKLYVAGYADDGGSANVLPFAFELNLSGLDSPAFFDLSSNTAWSAAADAYNNLAVAVDPDGSIIIGGNTIIGRFNSDLSPDTSFGNNGVYDTQVLDNDCDVRKIIIQGNGKILVMARVLATTGVIYRLLLNGALDTGFNGSGKFIRDNVDFTDIDITSDGRLIIVGRESYEGVVYCLQ